MADATGVVLQLGENSDEPNSSVSTIALCTGYWWSSTASSSPLSKKGLVVVLLLMGAGATRVGGTSRRTLESYRCLEDVVIVVAAQLLFNISPVPSSSSVDC